MQNEKRSKLQYIWLLVAAALVGFDRVTKWIVTENMELKQTINLIKFGDTEVLNFYYCLNDGAAFSKLSGQRWFLIAITSVLIIGFLLAELCKMFLILMVLFILKMKIKIIALILLWIVKLLMLIIMI